MCKAQAHDRICADCAAKFAPLGVHRCRVCALQLASRAATVCGACLLDPPPYDATLTAVDYGYPWDGLIASFKFHGALDVGPALTRLFTAVAKNSGTPRPDVLLPVPLSRERLAARGHNQAWQLARAIGSATGCRAEARWLIRVRDTQHQLALPPEQRAANVRGAFAVEPAHAAGLRGRHVAVVDDVMTSGATVAAVARTLKSAGAARVDIWVVARTPLPRDR